MVLNKNVDEQYFDLLQDILKNGSKKNTRSGEVISLFGANMRFNLKSGFPLLTTKKMFTRGVIHELLWFIKGDTNIKYLLDNNVHIWDDDAYRWYSSLINNNNELVKNISDGTKLVKEKVTKETFLENCKNGTKVSVFKGNITDLNVIDYQYGDLGDVYGNSFRSFGIKNVNQLSNIISTLKNNPDDRRMLCINYNPDVMDEVALAPCHIMFQFYSKEIKLRDRWELYYEKFKNTPLGESGTFNYMKEHDHELDKENIPKRELSCMFYCRSQDVPLGTPFNISSYAILTHMIAQVSNMSVGELIYNGGDCHIYTNQIEGIKEQLSRDCKKYDCPKLWINQEITDIDDFKYEDIKIENYQSYPPINIPLSVG